MFWWNKGNNTKNIKITKQAHAFKNYALSYNVEILNSFNPGLQLKNTEPTIKNVVKYLLNELGGFKFFITLFFKFKKTVNKDETKFSTFYLNSEAETVIHDADIDSVYEAIYITIMTKIQKYLAEGSG